MRSATILLFTAALLAGCGGASNTANSVVNTMNKNGANMPGANNNTGYVMNSNQTTPPTMPANPTNISPPSVNSVTGGNKNSNSHPANGNANRSNK